MARSGTGPAITLQQLDYFLAAVEHGSLSAAAESRFIAQPSLSEQIRRLERQLGVSLFVRTNRALILTEAARLLVPHAQRVLTAAQDSVEAVTPITDLTGGTVTFGTFSSARHLFHADLVEAFRLRHPSVSVQLIGTNSVRVAEEVREGRLETAIVALPVDDRGLDVEPIEWSPETVFVSADPERTAHPIDIARLAQQDLVMPETLWGDTDPTRHRLLLQAQQKGLAVMPTVEVESPSSAIELAARGVADTITTYSLLHHHDARDTLHWCSLDPPMFEHFGFIRRKGADPTPAAQALVGVVQALLADIPTHG